MFSFTTGFSYKVRNRHQSDPLPKLVVVLSRSFRSQVAEVLWKAESAAGGAKAVRQRSTLVLLCFFCFFKYSNNNKDVIIFGGFGRSNFGFAATHEVC